MGVKPLWLAGIQLMIKLIRINYVGKLKKIHQNLIIS